MMSTLRIIMIAFPLVYLGCTARENVAQTESVGKEPIKIMVTLHLLKERSGDAIKLLDVFQEKLQGNNHPLPLISNKSEETKYRCEILDSNMQPISEHIQRPTFFFESEDAAAQTFVKYIFNLTSNAQKIRISFQRSDESWKQLVLIPIEI